MAGFRPNPNRNSFRNSKIARQKSNFDVIVRISLKLSIFFILSASEFNNHWFVRCQFQISQSHFYIFRRFFALDNFIILDDFNNNHFHCKISPACSRASSWTVTKPKPKVILKSIGFISFPSRWIKIFSELNSRLGGEVYNQKKVNDLSQVYDLLFESIRSSEILIFDTKNWNLTEDMDYTIFAPLSTIVYFQFNDRLFSASYSFII